MYNAYLQGTSTYGLRRTDYTVEGDPTYEYLLVEQGNCRLIVDWTRDAWSGSSLRDRTSIKEVSGVRLFYYVQTGNRRDRVTWAPGDPTDKPLTFELVVGKDTLDF